MKPILMDEYKTTGSLIINSSLNEAFSQTHEPSHLESEIMQAFGIGEMRIPIQTMA